MKWFDKQLDKLAEAIAARIRDGNTSGKVLEELGPLLENGICKKHGVVDCSRCRNAAISTILKSTVLK